MPLSSSLKRQRFSETRGILVLLVIVIAWEISARLVGNEMFFPPFSSLFSTSLELISTDSLWPNYFASLTRVCIGFGVGASVGLCLGILLATSKWAERLLDPLLVATNQIPIFGLIPLFGLWFGMGETAKLVLVAIGAFYPVVLNTHEGLKNVSSGYRDVGKIFELNAWKTLKIVLLPCALPWILTGLKQGLAFAWISVSAAELFLTTAPGIGLILASGRAQLRMDMVLLSLFLIAVTGYLMSYGMMAIERWLLRWRPHFI